MVESLCIIVVVPSCMLWYGTPLDIPSHTSNKERDTLTRPATTSPEKPTLRVEQSHGHVSLHRQWPLFSFRMIIENYYHYHHHDSS